MYYIIYPFMFVSIGFLSIVRGVRKHPKITIVLLVLALSATFFFTKSAIKSMLAVALVFVGSFLFFGTVFMFTKISNLAAQIMSYIHGYDITD